VSFIGAAFHPAEVNARAFTWAVAAYGAGRLATMLDQHGGVDLGAEGLLDGFKVRLVAIAGKLHPVGQAGSKVTNERLRRHCQVNGAEVSIILGGRDQAAVVAVAQTRCASLRSCRIVRREARWHEACTTQSLNRLQNVSILKP